MNWISGFTLLIVILGVIIGVGLVGTDLLNPVTSQAEAERMQAETRHMDAMNQLEEQLTAAETQAEIGKIRHEMELEDARYQAELARIAADQNYYEQVLAIKLSARQGFTIVLIVLSGVAGIAIILIGTKVALQRIHVPAAAAPSTANNIAPTAQPRRHSPNGYEQMRIQARQRELLDRSITIRRMNAACKATNPSKEEYNKLPLAGD
jgi:UPF0716 family protein affecting phage T7 exclusion